MRRLFGCSVLPLALLAGCDQLTGFQSEISGRVPFDPPRIYAEWWSATEACSERSGDLSEIEWFLATSIVVDGGLARGAWVDPHRITIVRGFEDDDRTVRHEMLHDLLRGDPAHESSEWSRCDLR